MKHECNHISFVSHLGFEEEKKKITLNCEGENAGDRHHKQKLESDDGLKKLKWKWNALHLALPTK